MTDNDVGEALKKKWINLNLCNDGLISQQIGRIAVLTESLEITHILRYQGKLYFTMGKYEQALKYFTKLLELDPNDPFALRYQSEIHHIMEKYVESLVDLDKLLEIIMNETSLVDLKELLETNINIVWILKAYEEVARK